MVNPRHRPKRTAKPRSPLRLETDERRRRLLELGISLFSRSSYDTLSIGEIARLAGISKGLLYHYFPTKRDFYAASLRAAAEEMLHRTEAPQGASPEEALRHGLDAYLTYVSSNAAVYVSLIRGGLGADPDVATLLEEVRGAFLERLTRQKRRGRGDALRRNYGLRGWIGFVEHATVAWLKTQRGSRSELRELFVDQLEAVLAKKRRNP